MIILDKAKLKHKRHNHQRSWSSSNSYHRNVFIDHEGIEHDPEHCHFPLTTPAYHRRWRSDHSDSDSDSSITESLRTPPPLNLWSQPHSIPNTIPEKPPPPSSPITIKGFRRGFESLKLEFRIGLLRTRKKVQKVWKSL
ncbi:uncharacterized protein MELLADRAFT_115657 [Melampsora larici-populina 98AG31]|uniref:Uncharacterized protein n=1 Tax=Melampsora larici-populina (strain 98AG31 / pathotype 3-4-7) TaxID=747676 RepID=F4RCM5_MELLP|nr:uncharacterized protein MELLADRAFT_115657 [Melampsora larici-populina 98AG31]EGG09762.1 hypothetical protein MELLADRAFT_115657 [Melampsora larici-populina 98AG31]